MNGTTDYLEAYVQSSVTVIDGTVARTQFSGALIAPVNATAGGWQNDGTQSFLADSTDKVGVGTSTPWGLLSVNPNALGSGVPEFVVGHPARHISSSRVAATSALGPRVPA
jgi:hypothetical protein